MRSARTLWLIFAALLLNAAASAATTDVLLREARALAEEQQFARALEILREAQRQAPEDWEIVRALARTHLWSGDVERAAALLAGSPPRELANPDTQLLLGAIAYRRSDFAAAAAHYQRVVDEFPDYADAVALQRQILREVADHRGLADAALEVWQLDAGVEYSRFDDDRPSWDNEFVQLGRRRGDNSGSLYGRLMRYRQFEQINSEVELGLGQRLGQRLREELPRRARPIQTGHDRHDHS